MKFRTEINTVPAQSLLSYKQSSMFLGSCFSVNIFNRLLELKFDTLSNPFGIVYNPISLSIQLKRIVSHQVYTEADLKFENERWFSFDHHSDFSFSEKQHCLTTINESLTHAHLSLKTSKHLFITLGTSWVYTLNETGETVSNCHKLPGKLFQKELASTVQMKQSLQESLGLIKQVNPNIQVIFSVSPVRHLTDGNFENQVSKGRLFDAIYQLQKESESIHYFPAYEILMDDLRDYRFYNSDLLHPSNEAINYIWEKFQNTFTSTETQQVITQVEKAIQASKHRPFNSDSEAHQKFIQKTLKQIEALESNVATNFTQEKKTLRAALR